MLLLSGVFMMFLGFSHAYFSANLDFWRMNFTNKIKAFLETNDNGISLQCKEHLLYYVEGLNSREPWALRMLDAGAKISPPGVLDGNLVELGNFDECLNVEHHKDELHIVGKYCIGNVSIGIDSQQNPKRLTLIPKKFVIRAPMPRATSANEKIFVMLAKCFPDACSIAEMEQIYAIKFGCKIKFDEKLCQTKADQPKLDGGGIAAIAVFGVILCIVIISTAYDVVLYYSEKKPAHTTLIAFSAFTNFKKLIKTSNSSSEITCLHGIRAISTMWIILDHRYSIQNYFPMKNSFYYFNWVSHVSSMFMLSATLGVDTFFLLSGSLIVYNYMNTMNKGAKFNIILHYVHRYLRLTPVLVVMMVFHITLLIHTGSGPFWPSAIQTQLVEGCEIHWWKTLLYIQNIFGRGNAMCVPHSWYLSTDMQLFIVSPFLLLPLRRFPKLVVPVIGSLAVLSMITCFLIGWFFELNAFMQGNKTFEKEMDYVWYYYFPMHTRASPWLIGMLLGYIIFKTKEGNFKFLRNKVVNLVLWIVSLLILCTCVFAGHDLIVGEYNRLANSFHLALVRPFWATAIAWIIFACVNDCGGPVNWFLSLPIFQVVSKLTYSLYVVHYTLIYIITAQMRTTTNFSNFQAMYKFWGDFACAFAISVILVLTVEFPMITIDKCLFARREGKGNRNGTQN